MWEFISNDVNSVPNKTFSDNPIEDRNLKIKYLVYILRDIVSGFLKAN
jgi:hypothetical protein